MRALVPILLTLLLPATAAAADWTTPRTLPDSTGTTALPRVAMGLNGTVAVAFVRKGIRVAVRRDTGQLAPTTLVSSDRRAVTSPDVAISGRGDIVVVWTEARTRLALQAPYRVRAISYVPRRGWGRPRTLGETAYFDSAQPRISANARGDAAIAWRCSRPTTRAVSTDAICVTRRRAGGQFGALTALPEPAGTEAALQQQVSVGPKGSVHVAWTRLPGPVVRYAYLGSSGRWTAPRTLSAVPASRPRIAAAADGALAVAWHEAPVTGTASGITYGSLVATVRSPSGQFSPPQTISTIPIFEPEIAAAPSGEVMLAWSSPRDVDSGLPGAGDVHWSVRPAGAASFTESVTANGFPDGTPSFAPTGRLGFVAGGQSLLAVGGPHGVQVVWRPAGGDVNAVDVIDRAGDVPQLVTRRRHAAVVYATEGRQGEAVLKISVLR